MNRWVPGLTHHVCKRVACCANLKRFDSCVLTPQRAYSISVKAEQTPSRYNALKQSRVDLYPRFELPASALSCWDFIHEYGKWDGSDHGQSSSRTVHGRVGSVRFAGSKLAFLDIIADGAKVQGVCNLGDIESTNKDQFKACFQELQRGDIIKLCGKMCKTSSGEPSLKLIKLPELLVPCLHPLPLSVRDPETIMGKRHVGFLANEKAAGFIRAKSQVIQAIRHFLLEDDHIEVQTPILADAAGGAIARPFRTQATEFTDREVALRIAPELWLKRMVVGGFDRVFEIGPSFRNEGIDLTHNPEFSTCEFYRAYTDLEGLINMTEKMFEKVHEAVMRAMPHENGQDLKSFSGAYKRIDFITGIEEAIGKELPNLSSSTALAELKDMVAKLSLSIDVHNLVNESQILDKLCSEFLEPLCQTPTFITGHPECMSPLAKSYAHPTRPNQRIAARAELFVNGSEIANMYEEENSPFEQRRKFIEQAAQRDNEESDIDEAYLEALEWGLPPVGGWGCGIERLTMAMTGATRISDVLSFGTLRNVVSKHLKR